MSSTSEDAEPKLAGLGRTTEVAAIMDSAHGLQHRLGRHQHRRRSILTTWNHICTGVSDRVDALVRIMQAIPGSFRAVFSGVGTSLGRAGGASTR